MLTIHNQQKRKALPFSLLWSYCSSFNMIWLQDHKLKLVLIINNPYNKTSVLNIKQKATHLKLMNLCNFEEKKMFF